MSVRASERKEGDLQVLNLCSQLVKYTIERCSSEKVFPKKNRWIMSNKVAEIAIGIMSDIKTANAIYVQTKQDYELRRAYQNSAHGKINSLLGLIDITYQCFDAEARVIEYWSKLAVDTDEKLIAWMKSDKERCKKFI